MSVNSGLRAQGLAEADLPILRYIHMLADSTLAPEYKVSVLVHPSYFDDDEFLATLIARSTTTESKVFDLGLHEGKTREEALLGLLHQLEETAAKKSQNSTMDIWEECYRLKMAKQEGLEQLVRASSKDCGPG